MELGSPEYNRQFVNNLVEAALRIAIIFALLAFSFQIVRPFITPIIWGAIIAVSLMPLVKGVARRIGGRHGAAVGIMTLLALAVLLTPTIIVSESVVSSISSLADKADKGEIVVPPPPEGVSEWPVVGEQVDGAWSLASKNLEAALNEYQEQFKSIASWLLSTAGGGLLTVGLFFISIIIAGIFMANAESSVAGLKRFATRIVGDVGPEWVDLSGKTVMSVVQGVLGVALIQATLCAIGLFVMGIPAAGLWSVLVLVLAIMQLPPTLILLPIALWAFGNYEATPATIFLVYSLIAGSSDTFLKPMLMGRGLDVPMPVILFGAIGGMMLSGIIGLFTGAVVLAIWYKLFGLWLELPRDGEGPASAGPPATQEQPAAET